MSELLCLGEGVALIVEIPSLFPFCSFYLFPFTVIVLNEFDYFFTVEIFAVNRFSIADTVSFFSKVAHFVW